MFPGQPPPPGVVCDSGAPQGGPCLESRGRQRAQGRVGQWVSYAASRQGHTSPALAASPAKNNPSHRACWCPRSQDVVFPGGACWLLGLCVLNTVSLTAKGPNSPGLGRMGEAAPVAVTTWTNGSLPPFPEPLPPPTLACPTPHTPLTENPRVPDPAGSGMSRNVS